MEWNLYIKMLNVTLDTIYYSQWEFIRMKLTNMDQRDEIIDESELWFDKMLQDYEP
jgi:hypothetical protein